MCRRGLATERRSTSCCTLQSAPASTASMRPCVCSSCCSALRRSARTRVPPSGPSLTLSLSVCPTAVVGYARASARYSLLSSCRRRRPSFSRHRLRSSRSSRQRPPLRPPLTQAAVRTSGRPCFVCSALRWSMLQTHSPRSASTRRRCASRLARSKVWRVMVRRVARWRRRSRCCGKARRSLPPCPRHACCFPCGSTRLLGCWTVPEQPRERLQA
mmetsp:Transcript_2291/g.7240  ORF Transcript_2291/g.7240 Transcript_2291/m.7240 type:complete len:215 (-) Transcript_2291:621-1265(-)